MSEVQTLRAIRRDLAAAIKAEGVRGFARRIGVTGSFISRIQNDPAHYGPTLLAALGWRKITTYERTPRSADE